MYLRVVQANMHVLVLVHLDAKFRIRRSVAWVNLDADLNLAYCKFVHEQSRDVL